MDFQRIFLFAALLVVAAVVDEASGDAMVTGTVFCDQCKDGQVTLFDYPLHGIKVAMVCPGSDGQYTMWREETTNWLGNYVMRFDGTPDLNVCYVRVSGNKRGSNGCGAVAGPAKHLRLMFNMFDMEMYTVDPLVAQPAKAMAFCPRSAGPTPIVTVHPPPARLPPVIPVRSPPVRLPSLPPRPPPVKLPSLPPRPPPVKLPSLPPRPPPLPHLPGVPFFEAQACPAQTWMRPEYRCHWRVVTPETRVVDVFGLLAGQKYGSEMNLGQALKGRSEAYKTLLREATTALLNSYNSIQFPYHPVSVVQHFNWALTGSNQQVLRAALTFMRANSGAGTHATCRLTTCK